MVCPNTSITCKLTKMTSLEFSSEFERVEKVLLQLAQNLTRNPVQADSLLHDTASQAFAWRERFARGQNFKAWTFSIMKSMYESAYAKTSANVQLSGQPTESFASEPPTNRSHEQQRTATYTLRALQQLVADMDPSLRIPFAMFYQGMSYLDIANYLGIPPATVRTRIFLARRHLRAALERG